MKQLKMRVLDWWDADNEQNFYNNVFIRRIRNKYDVIYSDEPDYIIYGPFGYKHLNYDCVRIFYTAENVRVDWNVADYALANEYMEFEDRYLRYPYYCGLNAVDLDFKQQISLNDKNKFCSFMVTNPGTPQWTPRDMFFKKLCEYKKVDSGGRHLNNLGETVGNRYQNFMGSKRQWLKNYKFNICFENSSFPGYLTEKLFNAFEARCIPIYWGDTSLRCDLGLKQIKEFKEIDQRIPDVASHFLECKINPKAFINAHNFATWDELIEEVKRIDSDDKAYEMMFYEPMFMDNFDYEAYRNEKEKKINDFFDHIFLQEKEYAFRRGTGQYIALNNNDKKQIYIMGKKLADLETSLKLQIKENQALEEQARLSKSIKNSAKLRLKSHLAYKLGSAMIENSKSLKGYIRMPYVLSYIKDKHKEEQKAYEKACKENPSLKLPPLETYADYNEALKVKEYLSYKLGEALVKASNNAWGGVCQICV